MFFDWLRPADSNATRNRRLSARRRQAKTQHARRKLEVQLLEERRVLATWTGPSGGAWNVDAHWGGAPGAVPDSIGETADFGAFSGTVVLDLANANISALNFNAGSNVTINAQTVGNTITTDAITQAAGALTNTVAARLVQAAAGLWAVLLAACCG